MVTNLHPSPSFYPDAKRPDTLEDGREFQDFVMEALAKTNVILQNFSSRKYQFKKGENLQGWEIKLDNRCTETGRLSIEIAEKTQANQERWTDSGIYRTDSWLYIQGNYQGVFVFMTKILVKLHKTKRYHEHELPTIKKFYLPLEDAHKYGHYIGIEVH